ncbi:sensor histidine kinase [Leptolyngbya sp. PCC 6406]|uniref:sensor histidine kinase n=1 Tax=Leptolyngbya sp. PCC 6406 TaxID=1173264 RepID=UPI0002AC954A|nr:HAMP domain-containing sensor histidine kinase [Leptolyngbya sp. PCC 6406]
MASLLAFVDSVPSSPASAPAVVWRQACLAAGSNQVVLLDTQGRPLGIVALVRMLTILDRDRPQRTRAAPHWGDSKRGDQVISPEMTSLLESAPVIALETTPSMAAQIIAGAAGHPWLVIDAQQRYVGVLNGARLLDSLRGHSQGDRGNDASQADLRDQSGQGSTAMLTYLGHELKTPLTSLLGLSSLLHREHLGALSDRQSRYVSLIQHHTRRLTALVNAVLDLGRIEGNSLQLMPQIVEVAPLCQEAYRQAHLLTLDASAPVTDLPLNMPEMVVVADALRLGQMLTYLIQLALRAGRVEGVPLQVQHWGRWVVFRPLGLGQSITQLPQPGSAWEHGATLSQGDGVEIGGWLELLLTRRLAHLHGGDLVRTTGDLDPLEPVLLLPGSIDPVAPEGDRLVVLATADSELAIAVNAQVEPIGYHLLVTQPGSETLDVVARLAPAAVLVPVILAAPTQLLGQLKENAQTQNCPVIALVLDVETLSAPVASADLGIPWPSDRLTDLLQTPPTPVPPLPSRITVLYLKSPDILVEEAIEDDLSSLFHDCGCRVLEVDDLDQADLISRVWRPHVIVLDPALQHPEVYLQGISQIPNLAQLALITLTAEATQFAHTLPNLLIFPCLVGTCPWRVPEGQTQVSAWLMQVLQAAIAPKT